MAAAAAAAAARRQRRQEAAEAAVEATVVATVVATGVAVPGPEAVLDKKQHYGQNQSFFIEKGVWIKIWIMQYHRVWIKICIVCGPGP